MNHQVWRRRQRRRRELNQWSPSAREKISLKVICHNWSVSSPTTQTPSSSPALKGGCFNPFQQLAQEHDFTENLIHTSAVCLKFPQQWASYIYCAAIILCEHNLSYVHPGAWLWTTYWWHEYMFPNSHIQRYIFLSSCNLWTLMNLFHSTVIYTCNLYVSNEITILNILILHSFLFQQRPRWVVL